MAFLLTLALLQTESVDRARSLVEQLGAAPLEEREAAERELLRMGEPVRPVLEKAVRSGSIEVSQRARRVLQLIRIGHNVTPAFLAAVPDAEARLLSGEKDAWTRVFLDAVDSGHSLDARDFAGPAPLAFAGAATSGDRRRLCSAAVAYKLTGVVPYLRAFLVDRSGDLRGEAAVALGRLGAKEAVLDLQAALEDGYLYVRAGAAQALGELDARETLPAIARLLDDRIGYVKQAAAGAIVRMAREEDLALLVRCLEVSDEEIRRAAARLLCSHGRAEGVPVLLEAGKEREDSARHFFYINGVRDPETWARLSKATCARDHHGPLPEVLAEVAGDLGMTVDGIAGREDFGEFEFTMVGAKGAPVIPLLHLAHGKTYSIVLEKKRIRVLVGEAAGVFWTEWWERSR